MPSAQMKKIKQELVRQMKANLPGNLYSWTQVALAYNSNHIEGSTLTEEETRWIYETGTSPEASRPMDDVIETSNHFAAFRYVLAHCDAAASEDDVKELHRLLKRGTSMEDQGYAVGAYKTLPNFVGGRATAQPSQAAGMMADLMGGKRVVAFEDIVSFHVAFERIHPFQDGNGRVGRLLLFWDCLACGLMPTIVLDRYRDFYYRGLREWDEERGYLLDTLRLGQDIYEQACKKFLP